MTLIKNKSPVLFFYNDSKKWLMNISKKEELHTHIGVLKHADAIGKEYGSRLMTNKDKYVYLLEPTTYDYIMKNTTRDSNCLPKGSWIYCCACRNSRWSKNS